MKVISLRIKNIFMIDDITLNFLIDYDKYKNNSVHNVIDDATIVESGDFLLHNICLFGPNGSGKSSIINAIKFFYDCTVDRKIHKYNSPKNEPVEFELVFLLNDEPITYRMSIIDRLMIQDGFNDFSLDKIRELLISNFFIVSKWKNIPSKFDFSDTRLFNEFKTVFNLFNNSYDFKLDDGKILYKSKSSGVFKSINTLSKGTIKLIKICKYLSYMNLNRGFLIFDDIDAYLHHTVYKKLIHYLNTHNQSIVSTNTELTSLLFRSDQVVLCDNRENVIKTTTCDSLTDKSYYKFKLGSL
jgi:AAA15 family ATPase/GTPase